MNPELKEKIKQSMLDHLTTKGCPNITDEQIIQELPAMWLKLSVEGLLQEPIEKGMTYQHFVNLALHKKHQLDTMEEVARYFRNKNGQR